MVNREVFTNEELWTLLSFFGPSIVLGFQDPTIGMLDTDIREMKEEAITNLSRRGLVRVSENSELLIDGILIQILETITNPIHSVVVTKGQNVISYSIFHYADNFLVEHEIGYEGNHIISMWPNKEIIIERILHPIKNCVFRVNKPCSFIIDQNDLLVLTNNLSNQWANISNGEIPESLGNIEESFLSSLRSPKENLSIAVISSRRDLKSQHVNGLGILIGNNLLWLLKPIKQSEKYFIECVSNSATDAERKIKEVLP